MSIQIGEPTHKMGYHDSILRKRLSIEHWADFEQWIYGQTCVRDELADDLVYYTWDVQRWAKVISGKNIFD
jgi:hypothetical protein